MNGRTLFDPPPVSRTEDPEICHVSEELLNLSGRRESQATRILERLAQGPATNAELSEIALKYTGRISDLRHEGWVIECETRGKSGETEYRLVGKLRKT
jgi:hypothetical protein